MSYPSWTFLGLEVRHTISQYQNSKKRPRIILKIILTLITWYIVIISLRSKEGLVWVGVVSPLIVVVLVMRCPMIKISSLIILEWRSLVICISRSNIGCRQKWFSINSRLCITTTIMITRLVKLFWVLSFCTENLVNSSVCKRSLSSNWFDKKFRRFSNFT